MPTLHAPAIQRIEVELAQGGNSVLTSVTCVCRLDVLAHAGPALSSSKHYVEIGALRPIDTVLQCGCKRCFTLHPQATHFHVFSGQLKESIQFGRASKRDSTIANARVEPAEGGRAALIDVVCACGRNGLKDEGSDQTSFKHRLELSSGTHKILRCDCGDQFTLIAERSSVHILSGKFEVA